MTNPALATKALPSKAPGQWDQSYAICSAAGIDRWRNDIVHLQKIQRALEISCVAAEREVDFQKFLAIGLLSANIVKSTCEGFIELAGAIGKLAGIKHAGSVAKAMTAGIKVADSSARLGAGMKTDLLDTGISVAGALASDYLTNAGIGDAGKAMIDASGIQMQIINDSLNNKDAKAIQGVLLRFPGKMTQMVLYMADRKLAGNWVGAITAVANAGITYSRKLDEAFDERLKGLEDERTRAGLLRGMRTQLAAVKSQIAVVSQLSDLCLRSMQAARQPGR